MAILGVDVGGTVTDAVVLEDGRDSTGKVRPATRQEESVLGAARAAGAREVERFAHGTTVATNALLERKGARTAFVTNAGFEHLLHLRRQTRPELYRPCADWPAPRLQEPGRRLPAEAWSAPRLRPRCRSALQKLRPRAMSCWSGSCVLPFISPAETGSKQQYPRVSLRRKPLL